MTSCQTTPAANSGSDILDAPRINAAPFTAGESSGTSLGNEGPNTENKTANSPPKENDTGAPQPPIEVAGCAEPAQKSTTLTWEDLRDSSSATIATTTLHIRLTNPRQSEAVATIESIHDTGGTERFLVQHGQVKLSPNAEAIIAIDPIAEEHLRTLKYSGSIVAAAHILADSPTRTPETISTPTAFFEPSESGLIIRTETDFFASGLAGDFRDQFGGKEQKQALEAALGHRVNLRLVDASDSQEDSQHADS